MYGKLKVWGQIFLIAAVLTFLSGISTYFWPQVEGQVISYHHNNQVTAGYSNVGRPAVAVTYQGGDIINWEFIEYTYQFQGDAYQSSFLGIYLPFNNKLANGLIKSNGEINVFVFPLYKQVSVVIQGFDYRLVLSLFCIGLTFFIIRRWLMLLANGDWRTISKVGKLYDIKKPKYSSSRKKDRKAIRLARKAKSLD